MRKTIDLDAISILDGKARHYGADQHWFKKTMYAMSGCGPVTAALVTMYMAAVFPERCAALYPYGFPARKDEFVAHMADVRKYVRPGFFGLTDEDHFAKSTVAYAKSKGVRLKAQKILPGLSAGVAWGFIKKVIGEKYLPALLILKNPEKELVDFTWHWMAVTGYDAEKRTVLISTYAKAHELIFEKVWNQRKPYKSACVYFYPE
ncbi:MAG: hypothetical protein PHO15_06395 [Eubacteriales bacterium]|nr:hypothetical protein [Eubacteriales bacterium]